MPPKKKAAAKLKSDPVLLKRLRRHFGTDPAELPIVEQEFAGYERPNLHLALEEMLAQPERQTDQIGILVLEHYREARLAELTRPASAKRFEEGPVKYIDVPIAGGRQLACVRRALYLLRDDSGPVALLLGEPLYSHRASIFVEVMAADKEQAQAILRRLTRSVRHGKAFRGEVLSVEADCHGNLQVQFHQLPKVGREGIVLPEALLQRIERHTVSFTRHADRMRAAGRHIKRGILLHGAPGTGKTLSAMYLAAQMPGRTVLLMTGHAINSIETVCSLARLLEPATIILEDVDLIGTEREHQTVGANALLFELLNQMDGLAEDVDVLFVLTTNRPDVLEPALAARPGRIDQAIEIALPVGDCRRRLLDLYGRGLTLELADRDKLIARTEGVSGAFIRELLRKAAVFAAEDGGDGPLVVRDRHVDEAMGELLIAGGPLTQSLLGARPTGAART
jgi:cell division protease FtsH